MARKTDLLFSSKEQASFLEIQHTWNDLVVDYSIPESSNHRKTRYGIYEWNTEFDRIELLSTKMYAMYKHKQDDITRDLYPPSYGFIESAIFRGFLKFIHVAGCDAKILNPNEKVWHVDVTQYRISTRFGQDGEPTPMGPHHDLLELAAVTFVGRHNIEMEKSRLFDLESGPIFETVYESPLDTLIWNDRKLLHDVDPITVANPWIYKYGHRDVMIIGFNRPDFNPNFEGSPFIEENLVRNYWK